jgi:methylamine dehydrogenase heavy chain
MRQAHVLFRKVTGFRTLPVCLLPVVMIWTATVPTPAAAADAPAAATLPSETNDVAVLDPAGPHRVFVMGGPSSNGANVIDADSPLLKVLGLVPVMFGDLLVNRDASRIFVTETFYSHGNRGTREDVLSIYDGRTLNLTREILLPGRLLVVPKPHTFDLSADGRLGYVYDMVPGSRVHVVDLERGAVLTSVDLPGCALALPYGPRSFATICGDGTVGAVTVPESGPAAVKFSKPFFDANQDPLFESSVVDKEGDEGWFLTFSGKVFSVRLGASPEVGKPWTLSEAAGLPPSGTGVQELAWRPGASAQAMVLHHATKHLFVLMHTGNFWTHKQNGTEVWVLDTSTRTLLRRISLEEPARSISVSQDNAPLLYASGADGDFTVIDANTGEKLRQRKLPSGMATVPGQ